MEQDGVPRSVAARRPDAQPTVHDVARHAGVSSMTVSRVLSGGKNVSEDLRARVEASVKVLGYRRNDLARSIRPGQRTGLIGVTVTNIANPYFAEVLLGIEEVTSRHQRRILVGNTNEDTRLEVQLVSDFIGRQVEGLIVVPCGADSSHLTPEALGGIPVVLASRSLDGIDVDTVLIDDVAGAYAGTMPLLDAGHRRIAFLGNRLAFFTCQRRYDGFVAAHRAFDVDPDPRLVRMGQRDAGSAQQAMQSLLELDDPPTAVFSANNRNTVGALRALKSHASSRLRGSTDLIQLVGFDNFDTADLVPYPLTIVDHDARELGRQAAALLMGRLQGPRRDAGAMTIELGATVLD